MAFAVTGGRLNVETFAGAITHSGGIALSKGSTTVALTDFAIEISATPRLTAVVGGARVPIATLDLSGLKAMTKGRDISLAGVGLRLSAPAAAALNQAFGTSAFTEGLLLGTASVSASGG